jgi:MFS family permease
VLDAEHRVLTVGLVTTVTLVAFQALAIATAMPLVADELGDLHLYGWTFTAFFLTNLLSIVATGVWVDRRGLLEPFAAGIALVAIGLLVSGLAPSMAALVAGRAIQGLGAGAVGPIAYVAIGRAYADAIRPKMLAILSTAWIVPSVLGPALAALIAERASWRLIFLGLVPFLLVSALVTVRALRRVPVAASVVERRTSRTLGDALLIVVGAGLLSAAAVSGSVALAVPLAVVGIALGLPAVRRVVPRGTLTARRGLPATILARGVLTFAFFGADVYVPLALTDVRDLPASFAGLALTAASVLWTMGSWLQARFVDRVGARWLLALGQACLAIGIVGMAVVVSPSVPAPVALIAWAVAGLGMGLSYSSLTLVVLREASPSEQGGATSALQLSDALGIALGTGAAGAILATGTTGGEVQPVALLAIFGLTALVAIAGVALSRQLPGRRGPGVPSHSAQETTAPA